MRKTRLAAGSNGFNFLDGGDDGIVVPRRQGRPGALIDGLKAATKDTPKGPYHKTRHAPALLQSIQPALVRKAVPNCEPLFTLVLERLR